MTRLVRDAVPADADAIVAILIASKEASFPALIGDHDRNVAFWTDRWRRYLAQGSTAQMAKGDGFGLLAEWSGRPVGFAAYHHTARHDTDAELESIYVLKDVQGQGLGSELLHLIANRLHAEGSSAMCVGYDPRNPYKRFYRKHGAVEINPHWAVWRDLSPLAAGAVR